MDKALTVKLLQAQAKANRPFEISVSGVSMNPQLYEGDIITVMPMPEYAVGDIVVFVYKNNDVLVHRLLRMDDGIYYCKGDNSFRLEDINKNQIIGKVVKANGTEIKPPTDRLLSLSYCVNRELIRCRYDIEKTKQTPIYKLYEKTILRKEENIMIYKKNEAMDYIKVDDTSLAVFDPESGDTHFFDETGMDILECLSQPITMEDLLSKLCKIYDAQPEDIKDDVEEFITDTVAKKVVEVL